MRTLNSKTGVSLKTRNLGVSLAEVLVAMFVIVVGIAGVTATIWWGTKQADSGKQIAEASNIGRLLTENIILQGVIRSAPGAWPDANSGLNDAPETRRPIEAPPLSASLFLTEHVGANLNATANHNVASQVSRYTRNITCTRLAPDNTTYDGELCMLAVRIYWRDDRGQEHFVAQETITPHGK